VVPALHDIAAIRARVSVRMAAHCRDLNLTKDSAISRIEARRSPSSASNMERLVMNQLTVVQSNLPADIAEEADNLLAMTKSHERLLKFVKGKYKSMDDEVPLGTEYICHASQLTIGWIKFVGNQVVDRKMGRAAARFVPPERDELGDTDQSQWEVRDGELQDPWCHQHLLPLEHPETGEIYIFTTSSIGGKIATEVIVHEYAKRMKRTGSRSLPIVRLAVTEMKSKKYGAVPRPCFEVVGWEDAPAVSTMRTVNNGDDFPHMDEPPPLGDAEIEAMKADALRHANDETIAF